ncbi:MAG TPA: phosphatidylglycerophosphatase A [Opitutaceae bacterium]
MKLEQPQWTRHLPPEAVVNIATLGPVGMTLPAPGTWGSAAGVLFFIFCCNSMSDVELVVASALLAYFAIGICGQAEIIMKRRDPGEVILDEVAAIPLCMVGWREVAYPGFLGYIAVIAAAFALFRFYDIRKPWVINTLQELPGGWGIVLDDTAAALATCATLHLGHALWALVGSRAPT